jgi:hypothetical protein
VVEQPTSNLQLTPWWTQGAVGSPHEDCHKVYMASEVDPMIERLTREHEAERTRWQVRHNDLSVDVTRLRAALEQGKKLLHKYASEGDFMPDDVAEFLHRPADEPAVVPEPVGCAHHWQYVSDTFKGETVSRACIVCHKFEDLRTGHKTSPERE